MSTDSTMNGRLSAIFHHSNAPAACVAAFAAILCATICFSTKPNSATPAAVYSSWTSTDQYMKQKYHGEPDFQRRLSAFVTKHHIEIIYDDRAEALELKLTPENGVMRIGHEALLGDGDRVLLIDAIAKSERGEPISGTHRFVAGEGVIFKASENASATPGAEPR